MHTIETKRGPSIGEPAPDIESPPGGNELRLQDFKGSWLIMLSHPEELLPIIRTRTLKYLLSKRRTRLLLLGDRMLASFFNFRSLLKRCMRKQRVAVIEDSDCCISRRYGLCKKRDNQDTVKGIFVIDPKGTLRVKMYFPKERERNLYDILKLVDAIQKSDHQRTGCGGWRHSAAISIRGSSLAGKR